MPLCSAVLLVSPSAQPRVRAALEAEPGFTVGPSRGTRVALVIEAGSTDELTRRMREVSDRDDVEGVFPVYHSFEDEEPAGSYGRRGGRA